MLDVGDGDDENPYDGPQNHESDLETWMAPYPKQRRFDGKWREDQGQPPNVFELWEVIPAAKVCFE